MSRLSLVAAILLFVCTTAVRAAEIYVNNVSGDDRFTGTVPISRGGREGPCRTIARALRAAREGDTIVLANTGVPYRESITLQGWRNSGFAATPFVIEGNGAILDGTTPVPASAWRHVDDHVFRFRPRLGGFQQLYLQGVPLERVPLGTDGGLPPLKPLQWCFYDGDVYFCTEESRIPRSYELYYAGERVGLTLYRVERVIVRNLIIQGFQLDGVNAHDGVSRTELVDVVARGNGRSGFSVGGASRVKLSGCLAGDNGAAQLRTEGWCVTELEATTLIANTAPAIVREGGRIILDGVPFEGDVLDEDLE